MVAVTGNWCTHTPAKGCSYSFIRYVNNIVLFNPHFPSFCRVSKKFTMSQVEFMPMRLKLTPPSQRIRGSSLWPLTMAGNFSYIIGNSLVVDQCLNSELNFLSRTVYQKFWDPYGGNVYSYFCKKKIHENLLYWMNRFIRKFLLWHSEILDVLNLSVVTEDCKLKYSLPPFLCWA